MDTQSENQTEDKQNQTEDIFLEENFSFSQPQMDILYGYYREAVVGDKRNLTLFHNTFALYKQIPHTVFNICELRFCVKIALIYVSAFKNRSGYREVLNSTKTMIETLLKLLNGSNDALEILTLNQFVRVHDLGIENLGKEEITPIANMLKIKNPPLRSFSVSTQTNYTIEELEYPDTKSTYYFEEDTVELIANLDELFKRVQGALSSAKYTNNHQVYIFRSFHNLRTMIWKFIKRIDDEFPITSNYALGSLPLFGLSLSLEIQKSYMAFLDSNKTTWRNLRKISQAFQFMAQILKKYNVYFQKTEAVVLDKEQMKICASLVQDKSLNAHELFTYKTIIDCKFLTDNQRKTITEKIDAFKSFQVRDLVELFKSFGPTREEGVEPELNDNQYDVYLRKAIENINDDEKVCADLYYKATARLNLVVRSVFPSLAERRVAVPYIDGMILPEAMDFVRGTDFVEFYDNNNLRLQLLITLQVYYKIKIKYLEVFSKNKSGTEHADYLLDERYASQFRKEAYEFILLGDSRYSIEDIRRNCGDLQGNVELSTPFIQDSLKCILENLPVADTSEVIEVNAAVSREDVADETIASIVSSAGDCVEKSSEKVNILESIISEYGSMYVLQEAPGWQVLRSRVKTHIRDKNFNDAKLEIDDWLYFALQDSEAETMPYKRSIFEALFYKAVLEKNVGELAKALNILEVLNDCLVPKNYVTTRFEQMQQIICEKGEIYKLCGQLEESIHCYSRASDLASAHGVPCFPSLVHCMDISTNLDKLPGFVKYLENVLPITIDDYTLPYLHSFYLEIIRVCFQEHGGDFYLPLESGSLSKNTPYNFMQTALKIGECLLRTRFDERSYDIRVKILLSMAKASVFIFFTDKAIHRLQKCLDYVEELEGCELDSTDAAELEFFREIINDNLNTTNLVSRMKREKQLQFSFDKSLVRSTDEDANTILIKRKAASIEESQNLMLGAIKAHGLLKQISGVAINLYPESRSEEKRKLVVVIMHLESMFKENYNRAKNEYVEGLNCNKDLNEIFSPMAKIYNMKFLDMLQYDEYEFLYDITLNRYANEYRDILKKSKQISDSIPKQDKNLGADELLEVILPMREDLIIDQKIKEKIDRLKSIDGKYNHAITMLNDKKYWLAFVSFSGCLDEMTTELKKINHFCMGKILQWILTVIKSEHLSGNWVGNLFAQPEFVDLISDMNTKCRQHFDSSRRSKSIDNGTINEALRSLIDNGKREQVSIAIATSAGPGVPTFLAPPKGQEVYYAGSSTEYKT